MKPKLLIGDAITVMRRMPEASVDAIVCDPPYDLTGRSGKGGFMGKAWDGTGVAFNPETWREALRVLKPGGHLLAFGGSRTWHRLASAVEDAGFEIRDCITWHFGSGFPKSLNVTDALDRTVPTDARCVCDQHSRQTTPGSPVDYRSSHGCDGAQPQSEAGSDPALAPAPTDALSRTRADQPAGEMASELASTAPDAGSAPLSTEDSSPLSEPPLVARQPVATVPCGTEASTSGAPGQGPRKTARRTPSMSGLAAGSASSSSWRYQYMACASCGGLVIPKGLGTALKPATEFIVLARKPLQGTVAANVQRHGTGALNIDGCRIGDGGQLQWAKPRDMGYHGGSDAGKVEALPNPAGRWPANVVLDSDQAAALDAQSGTLKSGALKPYKERHENASSYSFDREKTYVKAADQGGASRFFYVAKAPKNERPVVDGVAHPTVKPLSLMRWLVRLVTPPGGTVLDPFAGSGTTGEAAILEGFNVTLIEREREYVPLIMARLARAQGGSR